MDMMRMEEAGSRIAACPTNRLLALLGQKWAPLTLRVLAGRPLRHGELRRAVPGVTRKMLDQTLRLLEANGLVRREVDGQTPPLAVFYRLSPLGESLMPVLSAISAWADDHDAVLALPQRIGAVTRRI